MLSAVFVFIHPGLDRVWKQAVELLAADGIALTVVNQMQSADWDALAAGTIASADAVYLEISRHFGNFDLLVEAVRAVPMVLPASLEARAALPQLDGTGATTVQAYLKNGQAEALADGVRWLLHRAGRLVTPPAEPAPATLAAIYHPATDRLWTDAAVYLAWADARAGGTAGSSAVAVIGDRSAWLNGDREASDACIAALEHAGLVPVPIFCDHELLSGLGADGNRLSTLIDSAGERLGAIWSALIMHGRTDDGGGRGPFARHGVPVFQLVRSWGATEAEWRASAEGLDPLTTALTLIRPEMIGAIEPTLYAVSLPPDQGAAGQRRPAPVGEQIARLAGRTRAWTRLHRSPNADKRVAIMLHNPPCKAVEATIGSAGPLDALQSTVELLRRLQADGYTVSDIPEDGAALLKLVLGRKAISEFRWTNVEEIVAKGGMLAEIGEAEYRADFDRLPAHIRQRVDKAWGRFPAKSMVHNPDSEAPTLVVTGLTFGNVVVMTEPKRGCWGARCDGEVCRILHEPDIAPPHHWLATFWYLQRSVDALVVMGAEGPLEYLPGKRVALSEECFPTISLGDLPLIYAYVMNNAGEGLIAKRRSRAVLVDHLSAPVAKAERLGKRWDDLEELHRQYLHAAAQGGIRAGELAEALRMELASLGLLAADAAPEALALAIDQLPRRLAAMRSRTLEVGRHVLGIAPDDAIVAYYVAETRGISGRIIDEEALRRGLGRCGDELDAVVAALSGGFVAPGPSGHLSRGRTEVLPTGRNFYGTDLSLLPTRAAFEVGARMGAKLLDSYLRDEGRFPETVGITLWSSDAFHADGELTAQILWLMGCAPKYDGNGKVTGIEVRPLDTTTMTLGDGSQRPRPRIDVVVQMSSVVRDVLPGIYALFDKAVAAVAELDEPDDRNFVRAHIRARMAELRATLNDVPEAGLKRLASYRCFSDADGAYGGGIGLALDASAWSDDTDLAEVVVNSGGHAFGADGKAATLPAGRVLNEYACLIKGMDLAYQRAATSSGDVLSGCYLGTQAGSAAAKRGLGGGKMRLYWGDTHSTAEGEVRTIKEELTLALATTLVNQDWFEEMKTRGYAGGTEVGDRANHLFGWSATTHEVDKGQFDAVHDMYVRNEANRAWLQENNVHALEELTRRLLEASARGLWVADEERLDELKAAVLAIEGDIEEGIGPVRGEIQGGSVDIKTRDAVEDWSYEFRAK